MRAIVKGKVWEKIDSNNYLATVLLCHVVQKKNIAKSEHSKRADEEENGEKKQHGGKLEKCTTHVLVFTIGKTSLSRIIHTHYVCVFI